MKSVHAGAGTSKTEALSAPTQQIGSKLTLQSPARQNFLLPG